MVQAWNGRLKWSTDSEETKEIQPLVLSSWCRGKTQTVGEERQGHAGIVFSMCVLMCVHVHTYVHTICMYSMHVCTDLCMYV